VPALFGQDIEPMFRVSRSQNNDKHHPDKHKKMAYFHCGKGKALPMLCPISWH
jgi:hypothetical protein